MKRLKHKKVAALLVIALLALSAVGAYAYFTNSGAGSGDATVGTSSAIVLSNVTVGNLYPGGADVPVTVDINNPGSGVQHVGTISGTVEDNGACLGSWFEVDNALFNDDIAPGGNDSVGTNVRMLDSGTNQDACKGLTVTINWTSN